MGYSDFDVFDEQLEISADLVNLAQLHIGGSESGEIVDDPVIKSFNGKTKVPFIPGSSLKGVLRSEAERVLRSKGENICELPDVCGKNDNNYCIVCGLFGGMGLSSHIRIGDAMPIDPAVSTMEKPGVAIHRTLGSSVKNALFNYEVVNSRQKFKLEIILDNIKLISGSSINKETDDKRVSVLIYLLKKLFLGLINIGGKTSSGLGKVEVSNVHLRHLQLSSKPDKFLELSHYSLHMNEKSELKLKSLEEK